MCNKDYSVHFLENKLLVHIKSRKVSARTRSYKYAMTHKPLNIKYIFTTITSRIYNLCISWYSDGLSHGKFTTATSIRLSMPTMANIYILPCKAPHTQNIIMPSSQHLTASCHIHFHKFLKLPYIESFLLIPCPP